MKTKSVKKIMEEHLKQEGLDGFYNPDSDNCACALPDIGICEAINLECFSGKKVKCPSDCGEHEFHIESILKED